MLYFSGTKRTVSKERTERSASWMSSASRRPCPGGSTQDPGANGQGVDGRDGLDRSGADGRPSTEDDDRTKFQDERRQLLAPWLPAGRTSGQAHRRNTWVFRQGLAKALQSPAGPVNESSFRIHGQEQGEFKLSARFLVCLQTNGNGGLDMFGRHWHTWPALMGAEARVVPTASYAPMWRTYFAMTSLRQVSARVNEG